MTHPDDTEPSAEACKAAAAVLPITWGKQLVQDVALALDRFRAAGVREAAKWCQVHGDQEKFAASIHSSPTAQQECLTASETYYKAACGLRELAEPPHDR